MKARPRRILELRFFDWEGDGWLLEVRYMPFRRLGRGKFFKFKRSVKRATSGGEQP